MRLFIQLVKLFWSQIRHGKYFGPNRVITPKCHFQFQLSNQQSFLFGQHSPLPSQCHSCGVISKNWTLFQYTSALHFLKSFPKHPCESKNSLFDSLNKEHEQIHRIFYPTSTVSLQKSQSLIYFWCFEDLWLVQHPKCKRPIIWYHLSCAYSTKMTLFDLDHTPAHQLCTNLHI